MLITKISIVFETLRVELPTLLPVISVTLGTASEFTVLVDCLCPWEESLSHCSSAGGRRSGVRPTYEQAAGWDFSHWSSLLAFALWMSWANGDWGHDIFDLSSLCVWVRAGWKKEALALLSALTR